MTLSPAWLDELRARTLLSALIGKSTKLQRAGREWKACCPFHNEKTPSFTINDDKGFYHCFGCGAHGDAIRWMTDQRGLPFMDAVKELAQAAGMEVPAQDPRAREKAERASTLHDVMAQAEAWFVEQLGRAEGAHARAYLKKRGISEALARRFRIGFSPDTRTGLRSALKEAGDDKLVECGLLIRPEEGGRESYDRFRGRLMIPIRDARGRTIAFGGRILGEGEPKYLNSPETVLFDKGRTLFNLDLAAAASRKANRVIVVEGYMDVIALAGAGIEEAVAPLGTALTEGQLERLWRMDTQPILCFDGDNAGQKAAVRAIGRALPFLSPGRTLRFLTLPGGQDPDDVIRSGGRAAMEGLLETPEPLVDRLWRHEEAALPLDTPEARAGLKQRLVEHSRAIADRDVSSQYFNAFRERIDERFAPQRRDRQSYGGTGSFRPKKVQDRRGRWVDAPTPPHAATKSFQQAGAVGAAEAHMLLLGLLAIPDVIRLNAEPLSRLQFNDAKLDGVRDALVQAAYHGETLEGEGLATILQRVGAIDLLSTKGRANRLAFSRKHGDAQIERARRDLGEMIDTMVRRSELDARLAETTIGFGRTMDEKGWEEQQHLLLERHETERRLSELREQAEF
ncbi:DNA primase [Sphingomonas sp. CGMCC 1.13654]|uniref:DNA primase n=1 Tax=Sphingomonas chungangi TaxID=2683589 RepID=A0A838LDK7_9SPHN|nr:DNA primase [Sphingomonas chungangi]MBA2936226.1 DNA primase [Sphingomonas chungangi]MVW55611.1 DNA primase [Sphingomonas chungangi]